MRQGYLLTRYRISELAREYRAGRLLPSTVTERILEQNEPEGVFRFELATRARAQAVRADELFRHGIDHSLLQGIPIGLKDLIDTRGTTTTMGSAALADAEPAQEDADVAAALDGAGAVFIGKTTMTELAFSGLGLNQHSPIPANALDPSRVPGGSSSGSTVGVASGVLAAAIGSDTGGSVRIPAAFNGLVGLKPSEGALSMHGVAKVSISLDTLGPIAWDTADAWALWSAMSGIGSGDLEPQQVSGLRLAVPTTLFLDGLDDEVGQAFEQTCEDLVRRGADVERVAAPAIQDIHDTYTERLSIGLIEAYATFERLFQDHHEIMDPRVVRRLSVGVEATGADLARLHVRRRELTRHFWRAFQGYDALLAPTVPILPPLLTRVAASEQAFAEANTWVVRNTRIANYLGCPAATVPAPHAGAPAPIGIMVMTRPGQEHLALSVASAVEATPLGRVQDANS